jgi:hypothetical protein
MPRARTMAEMLAEEGPEDEDVITPGLLEDVPEPAEEPAADWSQIVASPPPPAPGQPAAAPVAGGPTPPPLVRAPESSPSDALRKAQRADAKQAALDSASDALYTAFARKAPARATTTPSKAEALLKQHALERQGKADARQEGLDADNAKLRAAQIAKMGRGKEPLSPASLRVLEKTLGYEPGALDGVDPTTIQRITGVHVAGANRSATDERARLHREAMLEAARIGLGVKKEEKIEGDVQKLGKDLEGTASLQKTFSAVDAALQTGGADKPGVGWWDSRKPEIFNSQADTTVKQGLKQIIAVILKKQSGSTVSEDEYRRTLASYGISSNSTEEAFMAGYGALKRAAAATAKEAEAKYKPEVADKYRERGGVGSADLSGGDTVMVVPPGSDKPVPVHKSKLAAALAAGGKQVQ